MNKTVVSIIVVVVAVVMAGWIWSSVSKSGTPLVSNNASSNSSASQEDPFGPPPRK